MEEFYSPVWQEYLGGVSGIVFTIIIILLFVFTFRYLRKKPISPTAPSQVPQAPDELPTVETSQPEPLLIHCPACGDGNIPLRPVVPKMRASNLPDHESENHITDRS